MWNFAHPALKDAIIQFFLYWLISHRSLLPQDILLSDPKHVSHDHLHSGIFFDIYCWYM